MVHERKLAASASAAAEPAVPESATGTSRDVQETEAKKMAVSIRSANHPQPVTFRVKVSITCGALLKRYLKDRGLSGKATTRLQIDGEDLDGEQTVAGALEAADFDDDEEEVQLDVAGL